MNRQILFRGKRLIHNDWVECESLIQGTIDGRKFVQWEHTDSNEFRQYEVRPETVGQFTGIFDAKGEKIFEGDIISTPEFDHNLLIGYSPDKSAFVGSKTTDFSIKSIYNFLDDIVISDGWEVIGNRFEDPEYLTQK